MPVCHISHHIFNIVAYFYFAVVAPVKGGKRNKVSCFDILSGVSLGSTLWTVIFSCCTMNRTVQFKSCDPHCESTSGRTNLDGATHYSDCFLFFSYYQGGNIFAALSQRQSDDDEEDAGGDDNDDDDKPQSKKSSKVRYFGVSHCGLSITVKSVCHKILFHIHAIIYIF